MNKVILIGNTTRDIEVKPAGQTTVAKLGLAVSRPFKKDETDFINCIAWGKTADTLGQYVSKGTKIAIEGRIQTGSYDKDGTKVYTTDVVIDRFEFVGGKVSSNNEGGGGQKSFEDNDLTPVGDDDMPF